MTDTKPLEFQLRDEFGPLVREQTPDTIAGFVDKVMARDHDYGSICVALGLCAAATAWALNKHPNAGGGITGFQAGAVFWEFVRHWGSPHLHEELGGRIINYGDLLYPQYDENFASIPQGVAKKLAGAALAKLKSSPSAHPEVIAHWERLAAGEIPFGLSVAA